MSVRDLNARVQLEAPDQPPASGASENEGLPARQLTQMQLVWLRFRRHRLAMVGTGVLLFMALMAIFAPVITPEAVVGNCDDATQVCPDIINAVDLAPTLSHGLRYLFGSDYNGHSIAAQIIYGARYSLLIGFSAAILTTILGAAFGAISGFFGGWTDTVMMRTVDVFLTLPSLPILLTASAIFGQGHTSVPLIILIFTFLGWAYTARLVRSLFLSLRTVEYAEAARAAGVPTTRIIFRHLMPNALRPILVTTTLAVANFIIFEAAVDYLGFGLQYPDTSWGSVLAFAQQEQFKAWWVTIFPGLFLIATIIAVNFVGDGLSDALDVRAAHH